MSTPSETATTKPEVEKVEAMETEAKPETAETKPEETKADAEAKPEPKPEEEKSEPKPEEKPKDEAKEVKKPETFFVEGTPNSTSKKFEGARNAIKQKSIDLRPQLMKFPGARRIHCTEESKDPLAHAVVIRIEKTEEFKLPEEFGDMMKLDKDATAAKAKEKGILGVYEMNDKSCKIWVKEFDAGKIKALRAPKKCPNPLVEAGRMKNSKEPTKFDEDATEAEANAKPDAKPESAETKPAEPADAKPAEPADKVAEPADKEMTDATKEDAEAPKKRPREETGQDAPPAKKAKVDEETKPSAEAAAAAVC